MKRHITVTARQGMGDLFISTGSAAILVPASLVKRFAKVIADSNAYLGEEFFPNEREVRLELDD